MQKINFMNSTARDAQITKVSPDCMEVTFGAAGGGITFAEAKGTTERYIVGNIEILEEHSVAMTSIFIFFISQLYF